MAACLFAAVAAALAVAGFAAVSGASVCLNEILYDPAGSDAGYEFVELYNPGIDPVDLEGWRIEAGNGSGPGQWRPQWEGKSGARIAPRGFYVVAGPMAEGPADERAPLALQNGPDAVRLVSPPGCADLVGWGALEFEEYYEGAAALDVPGGWVLARIPDGADTDRNDQDLHPRQWPSPGEPNASAWKVTLSDPRCDPPALDFGGCARIVVEISNHGMARILADRLALRFDSADLSARSCEAPARDIESGESVDVAWVVESRAASGIESRLEPRLAAYALSAADPEGEEQAVSGRVQIGRGPALISEVQYDARSGEGEWVEIWNGGPDTLCLAGWRLRDASGRMTVIAHPATLAPGAWMIVAEDAAGLRQAHPGVPAECLAAREGAWPALNNSLDRELGYADEVALCDPSGLAVDYVRYAPGDLEGAGVSLERWIEGGQLIDPVALMPCPDAAGATPGCWSRLQDSGATPLMAPDPCPFSPGVSGEDRFCLIRLPAPMGEAAEITADIFTLAGTRVATLAAGARTTGPLVLAWNGRDSAGDLLPTGIYLVRAAAHGDGRGRDAQRVLPVTLFSGDGLR